MSSTLIIVFVFLLAAVLVLGLAGWVVYRRRSLRDRFGPEYDRVVGERASRAAAERELRDRERRHAQLTLRELTPDSRARYSAEWQDLQSRFLDEPGPAVDAADELVTRLIEERGYPAGDHDEQVAQLSVDHALTLDAYREAHAISVRNQRGEASTEELRQAVVSYRALVVELLGPTHDVAHR
ncbi:hypothetical protein AB0M43_13915 [Longispora sp. NPDC051575]|uniref:hypothetical protein n=1 Tax=Longispora sp. NPDC051575 TaxID=3154943 RepID=UPI0034253E53